MCHILCQTLSSENVFLFCGMLSVRQLNIYSESYNTSSDSVSRLNKLVMYLLFMISYSSRFTIAPREAAQTCGYLAEGYIWVNPGPTDQKVGWTTTSFLSVFVLQSGIINCPSLGLGPRICPSLPIEAPSSEPFFLLSACSNWSHGWRRPT